MSIEAVSWVMRHSDTTLGARLVLLSLADHAHPDGKLAYPSVLTIARQARLSERQVQRCLRELEEMGAIEKTGHTSKGIRVWTVKMSPDFLKDGYKDGSGDISDTPSGADVTPSRHIVTPGECPECGVTPRGKSLAEHREDVHGVLAA